ncbi:uncharacterized protein LOC126661524 [Mercurialis annua]|uniref:uncharacterized protein LOC126661524 n=1 Tax=Mercurialis annua TaxID=3986 RepID=UPI00215EB079|nr:uncharacterized protein LOC126661524 [Mercurialis annua]XP_050211339.1 uncharacterized protein LOC126661524 [Mercurialis annua]XP_050211345.1 uncharacterized protein LOC126661524 [Mercurialis annua]XP_055960009.1 uncharacterized protein LOC126661524 [Mercurialis annua]
MKGVAGGPLLCIGDLLSDLDEKHHQQQESLEKDSVSSSSLNIDSNLDLTKLFQEHYTHLNSALSGTDHSWTALTLKLCTSLETANELIQSTNSNVMLLSERVQELEKVVKRGDSAVAAAKAIHVSLNQKGGSFSRSQNSQ